MRVPRRDLLFPGAAFHIWWRGHNREAVLESDTEKNSYLAYIRSALDKVLLPDASVPVRVHSFCLMSNHVHMAAALDPGAPSIRPLSAVFQRAHSMFGRWYNRRHQRSGKVAEERFKTRLAEDDRAVQTLMFYGDANPVKAKIVKHPKDYRWSSYAFYAYGKVTAGSELLTAPQWYQRLGRTARERQRRYRQMVDEYLRHAELLDDRPPPGNFVGTKEFVSASVRALRELLAGRRVQAPP